MVWNGKGWDLRDLGSRNGTWVDGRKLGAGEASALVVGSTVAFGEQINVWEVVDAGPPAALAESVRTGELRLSQDGILALPDEVNPEAFVFADARGRWVLEESEGEPRPVSDGEIVSLNGATWRIFVPEVQRGTATMAVNASLDTVRFRFAVSRNEEYVEVTVSFGGKSETVEAREHWYTLLTLARQRLEDRALPAAEQGWIERDDLLKMLSLDSNSLNVAIYRARRQLQAAGIDGAASLVEVRRGQRRIGVSPDRLEVVPL